MGYGPMSIEIIELLTRYASLQPLMLVASRNQVDYQNAYVCNSSYLGQKISKNQNILLCRDHCGPYFKDTDKSLSLTDAILECKKTIEHDIEAGFDLIHIDVSKVQDSFKIADDLITFTLDLNPNIFLEFGSEENTGQNLDDTLSNLDKQLNYCQQYKDHIKFFVSQTGSFIKNKQLGKFDTRYNRYLSDKIHDAGFLFKEHNGDYLTKDELTLRKLAGVDAINVAPQLGVIQTEVLLALSNDSAELQVFIDKVYNGNKYQRWLNPKDYNDVMAATNVSGHYFFNTFEYKNLLNTINVNQFQNDLEKKIFDCLDTYKEF